MNKNLLWTIGIIVVVVWTCNKCNRPKEVKVDELETDSTVLRTIDTNVVTKAKGISVSTIESQWHYRDDEDKMTSKKTYYASVDASEKLEFDFPYDGGTTATLYVRKKAGKTDVFVSFSKAQLLIDSYEGSNFRVRFDNAPPSPYTFMGAADHSSDVGFLQNTSRFIKNLKSHKKVIIEMEFYQEGARAIEFNINGFKWNH